MLTIRLPRSAGRATRGACGTPKGCAPLGRDPLIEGRDTLLTFDGNTSLIRSPTRSSRWPLNRPNYYVPMGFTSANLSRRIIPNSGISSHRPRSEINSELLSEAVGQKATATKDGFAFSSCMACRWHSVWLLHYAGVDSLSGLRIGEVALTTSSNLSDRSNNFIRFSGRRSETRRSSGATSDNGVAGSPREKPACKTTVLKA